MNHDVVAQELIEVSNLRVGMVVHLDVGWMAHPFPLGSFRIANTGQIDTIRSLGVKRVRCTVLGEPAADAAPADLAAPASRPAAPPAARRAPRVVEAPEVAAQRRRQRALAGQHAAQQRCERQFREAARACRQLTRLVPHQPEQARVEAEALSKSLVDQMIGDAKPCIRLLVDTAGDKASTHAMNVTVISLLMGASFGLPEAEMMDLGVGAMLHDIGKIGLPEDVRHREQRFSGAAARAYEDHVARGVESARKMGLSAGAALVIAQHHEHADGSGFPQRLGTDRMSAAARIVALVDRYDNLCNPPTAADALTPHEALSLLFTQGKNQFDTAILGAFIRMMGVYPTGSTVQLTDDRYALVVGMNALRPLRPRVLVHTPGVPRDDALILDLVASQGLGIRRGVRPAQLPMPSLQYLAPRPHVTYFFESRVDEPDHAIAA